MSFVEELNFSSTQSLLRKVRKFQFSEDRKRNSIELAMLDAAADCFSIAGYEATSIDAIAERIGSTKGLIYYNFKSKPDLFFSVYAYGMSITIEFIQNIINETEAPSVRIFNMARAHMVLMMHKLAYHHVTKQGIESHLASALRPHQRENLKKITSMRDTYEKLYRDAIDSGVAEGSLRDYESSYAAKIMLGGLNGVSTWYKSQPNQTDGERCRLIETIVNILIRGLLK